MTVLYDTVVFQRISVEEHYGSDFTYEVVERPVGTETWRVVETLPSDTSSSTYTLRSDSVELGIISTNEIGSTQPSTVFNISSTDLG